MIENHGLESFPGYSGAFKLVVRASGQMTGLKTGAFIV